MKTGLTCSFAVASLLPGMAAALACFLTFLPSRAVEPVKVDTFVRAETDSSFAR